MSNRNNDVFQVLVTTGNQALLPAGSPVDSLAVGQLGCFDANTNLSVTTAVKDFYFAVGLDRDGDTVMDDARFSAGQYIQRSRIAALSYKPHTAGRPHVMKVQDYLAKCDTDYAVKVEFRNSRIYSGQGFNQFTKTFAVRTGCCDDCASGCDTSDANLLTIQMVNEINNNASDLLIAQITARQAVTIATHGTSANYADNAVMTEADAQALATFNALSTTVDADKVYTDFVIISKPITGVTSTIPYLHFHMFVQTILIVSLTDGFGCSGITTEVQTAVNEQGQGNNIREKEYKASAWNGAGPYPVSPTLNAANTIDLFASATVKYDQFQLESMFKTEAGWQEYENPITTIFAIPATDTVTRNALATLLDLNTATLGFEALADDAAAASTNPATIEGQPADATKDGVA